MAEMTDSILKAITYNLQDFGYNVTEDYVKVQIGKIKQGEKEDNIIMMMVKSQLEQNGLL